MDVNTKKLKKNAFRVTKERGLTASRVRVPGGHLDAKYLSMIQEIAETYGDGSVHMTVRQGFEIPGIRYEDMDKVNELLQPIIEGLKINQPEPGKGYSSSGTRNISACVGNKVCPYACYDTSEFAFKIEKAIFPDDLHVKVALTGCPNDCAKGHFQDFGIIGCTKPIYDIDRCIGCGACVDKCKGAATRVLSLNDKGKVDKDPCCCVGCGECVIACPAGAWRRPDKDFYKIVIGGRTGKQYPRMGKMFANWLTEDSVLAIMSNWPKFSEWVLGGKPVYLHGGHLIDRAGYQKFKDFMLDGVTLNPEAYIAETINWAETEYRSNIHVKPLDQHETVK